MLTELRSVGAALAERVQIARPLLANLDALAKQAEIVRVSHAVERYLRSATRVEE